MRNKIFTATLVAFMTFFFGLQAAAQASAQASKNPTGWKPTKKNSVQVPMKEACAECQFISWVSGQGALSGSFKVRGKGGEIQIWTFSKKAADADYEVFPPKAAQTVSAGGTMTTAQIIESLTSQGLDTVNNGIENLKIPNTDGAVWAVGGGYRITYVPASAGASAKTFDGKIVKGKAVLDLQGYQAGAKKMAYKKMSQKKGPSVFRLPIPSCSWR